MRTTIDIETKPKSHQVLLDTFRPQFEPPSNYKDPVKIQEYVRDAEIKWVANSALHAERAEIIAIGVKREGEKAFALHGSEVGIIENLVEVLHTLGSDPLCGFNILNFDLPFIRRRAMFLGVDFPFNYSDKWKPWPFAVFDAAVSWQCGNRQDYVSEDVLLRAFGIGEKPYDGADFANLFDEDEGKAIDLLMAEVTLTEKLVERMM